MFGCCHKAMSVIYINEQGDIDPEYIKANYPEGSKLAVQDQYHAKVVDPSGKAYAICLCGCHKAGCCVMC